MVEIYRIEKGQRPGNTKHMITSEPMRSAWDRTFRLNWNSDRTRAKMICRRLILIEDHKPVAGCRIAFPDEKIRARSNVSVLSERKQKRRIRQNPDPGSRELVKKSTE